MISQTRMHAKQRSAADSTDRAQLEAAMHASAAEAEAERVKNAELQEQIAALLAAQPAEAPPKSKKAKAAGGDT